MPAPTRRRTSAPSRPHRRPTSGSRPIKPAKPSAASELDRLLDEALAAPAPEAASFAELGVSDALVKALARRGIAAPFAIQSRTLPDGLAGRDVLGRAQTGSGKTLGFALPMIPRFHEQAVRRQPLSPRGLVLVPTRELAVQVAEALSPLAHSLNQRV